MVKVVGHARERAGRRDVRYGVDRVGNMRFGDKAGHQTYRLGGCHRWVPISGRRSRLVHFPASVRFEKTLCLLYVRTLLRSCAERHYFMEASLGKENDIRLIWPEFFGSLRADRRTNHRARSKDVRRRAL